LSEDISPHKRRTVIKSFRLSEELVSALEAQAKEEGTTINGLCSTVLTRHVEWGALSKVLGMVSFSSGTAMALLESADPKTLAAASRRLMPEKWKGMVMFKNHELTIDGFLDLFKLITKYGYSADLDVQKNGREYRATFRHHLGPKFSLILHNAIDELLRTTFHVVPTFEVSDETLAVTFSEQ